MSQRAALASALLLTTLLAAAIVGWRDRLFEPAVGAADLAVPTAVVADPATTPPRVVDIPLSNADFADALGIAPPAREGDAEDVSGVWRQGGGNERRSGWEAGEAGEGDDD